MAPRHHLNRGTLKMWPLWVPHKMDLSLGEVHLFVSPLSSLADAPLPLALLSQEEQAQALRFVRPRDQLRWATSRSSLRSILGHLCDTSPHTLRFDKAPKGKPFLTHPLDGPLYNVSHSGDYVLCALTTTEGHPQLGGDIELMRDLGDMEQVARYAFSGAEFATWQTQTEADVAKQMFYRIWTQKEAYIKAIGQGLHLDLKSFDVNPHKAGLQRVEHEGSEDVSSWHLWTTTLDRHHVAMALNRPIRKVHLWRHELGEDAF